MADASSSERAPKRPRVESMPEQIRVPPDGLCLAHCCVAARDVRGWGARDSIGHAVDPRRTEPQREAAKAFQQRVVDRMRAEGRTAQPQALEEGEMPMDIDISWFAEELGGTIAVRCVAWGELEPERHFGEGPLVVRLLLTESEDGSGTRHPHFILLESFLIQPPAA